MIVHDYVDVEQQQYKDYFYDKPQLLILITQKHIYIYTIIYIQYIYIALYGLSWSWLILWKCHEERTTFSQHSLPRCSAKALKRNLFFPTWHVNGREKSSRVGNQGKLLNKNICIDRTFIQLVPHTYEYLSQCYQIAGFPLELNRIK